jgi:light-regulated signal transduction histidine kinase (bacteriophytochrome)
MTVVIIEEKVMSKENTIKVWGNDAVAGGYIEISYNRSASVSPLHLDFTREDGLTVSMSLTHNSVKELLKLIVGNL